MHSTVSLQEYFEFSLGFDVQINQAFCGMATTASALNSLNSIATLPQNPAYKPYPYATQDVLVNDCVSKTFIA